MIAGKLNYYYTITKKITKIVILDCILYNFIQILYWSRPGRVYNGSIEATVCNISIFRNNQKNKICKYT